jgi:hypothetical protein
MNFDYPEVKNLVTMARLLEHYEIQFQHRRQIYIRCPLPHHTGNSGKTSFNVNLEFDKWHCWETGCKAINLDKKYSGNVLGFVMAMEGCGIKEAAEKVIQWFGAKPEIKTPTTHLESAATSSNHNTTTPVPEHNLVDWLEGREIKTPPTEVKEAVQADNPSLPQVTETPVVVKGYFKEVDVWFDALVARGDKEGDKDYWQRVRNGVKSRLKLSYDNGKKAKAS